MIQIKQHFVFIIYIFLSVYVYVYVSLSPRKLKNFWNMRKETWCIWSPHVNYFKYINLTLIFLPSPLTLETTRIIYLTVIVEKPSECTFLCLCCSLNIHDILTMVNLEVGKGDAMVDGGHYKQIPAPQYTLMKKLIFTPVS